MSDPDPPIPPSSSGAAAFLARRREMQHVHTFMKRRQQRTFRLRQLDDAVTEFMAALPRVGGNRPRSPEPEDVADAFVKLVADCQRLQVRERLERLLAEEASIKSDQVAHSMYASAAAAERQSLVEQIDALGREAPDFQGDVWALVRWRLSHFLLDGKPLPLRFREVALPVITPPPPAEQTQWLTVTQAARAAACSAGIITRAVDRGELKSNG